MVARGWRAGCGVARFGGALRAELELALLEIPIVTLIGQRCQCAAGIHHLTLLPRRLTSPAPSTVLVCAPAMRSRYTCQHCLASLQRGLRPQRPSSIRQLQAGARRWNSSQSTTARASASALASQPATTKRALGTQSQAANNEAHRMPPSPPGLESAGTTASQARSVLLKPNNLFHGFSNSPSPEIRRRAAFIKQHAYCPHHSHQQTRIANDPEDPEVAKAVHGTLPPAHVRYECPDCGVPVSCSEEHFADDYERHLEICDTLREINEDDHDLRSGRFFPEFEYPGMQMEEALVNYTNWDTYLYSREHQAINDDRSLRQATRLLTYPVTIGSVLHELSPYSHKSGGRLTTEGLKSLSGRLAHP